MNAADTTLDSIRGEKGLVNLVLFFEIRCDPKNLTPLNEDNITLAVIGRKAVVPTT